ncbi:hypothetical protein [Saccharothrix variisporea]|uniref:Uncharacterized protein n=1 Tax=Saccharothrix variisporea TaxID=543527 RepID=A0A495WYZ4_9PSEU|nr:hypothetical protein [Saccharothrix variisporea]RKT67071.1 hypothetical protein DFJ66_0239 [Saccharothrix variisporea]
MSTSIQARDGTDPDTAKKAAEAKKAEADARAAETAADRAAEELVQWREKNRRDQWAALVPDLSKVQLGTTSVAGDHAVRGSALALRAVEDAAGEVVGVVERLQPTGAVLITDDVDLAGGEASRRSVLSGLEHLTRTAERLLAPAQPRAEESPAALALGSVVAQAVPALMSLASPKRSLTTSAAPVDDLACAATVIGKLVAAKVRVLHDAFRMPAATRLEQALTDLTAKRDGIAERADQLGDDPAAGRLRSFVASVDAFTAAIAAVPEHATRSPWADACLREALHDNSVEYVVLVKGVAGSTTQLVNDRPFGRDDVSVTADVSITYLVLRLADNRLVAAGAAAGTATMTGKIGRRLRVTP